jgi:ubiquinone/menaquinone biosynthesis C-methylase UbiE
MTPFHCPFGDRHRRDRGRIRSRSVYASDPMSGGRDIPRSFAAGTGIGSEVLSTYLESVSRVMAEHKRETIEAMGLRAGDAGLDVGCGVGDEVRLIAERVTPSGRAVGVDVNEGLLATARERTPRRVEATFLLADAHALPFADGEFAAARVERALQHMTDPRGAVAEMARVVRTGGRLVALEPDWETLVISCQQEDTTRAVRDEMLASTMSPTVGRNLGQYFADAGMALETVEAKALVIRDPATATRLFLLDEAAARVGTDAANQWLADLSEATAQGGFCAVLTQFVVAGTKVEV